MTTINKPMLQAFRKDFQAAMTKLEEQYKMKLEIGNISFDSLGFRTTLKGVSKDQISAELPGNVQWQKDFKLYAAMYGMSPDDLGKEVPYKGEMCKVIGLRPRAKHPIVIQQPNNSKFTAVSSESLVLYGKEKSSMTMLDALSR
jgi:hypothetical protein